MRPEQAIARTARCPAEAAGFLPVTCQYDSVLFVGKDFEGLSARSPVQSRARDKRHASFLRPGAPLAVR
jgi:hypothetical protein